MTRETADAVGTIVDRLTQPLLAMMFCASMCWIGLRTVNNISADQFVGIIMMVAGFYFGRQVAQAASRRATDGPATAIAVALPGEKKDG